MKKLILGSVFVGTMASVPILYESNPEAVRELIVGGSAKPAVTEVATKPSRAVDQSSSGNLSGRRHSIPMDASGHFRDEFKLNGRRVSAMVDTGATLVGINMSTARSIGIKLKPEDFKYQVHTANGAAKAAAATIERLQIGRIDVENVDAVILDDKALTNTLIGMSFLKRLSKYGVADNKLELVE